MKKYKFGATRADCIGNHAAASCRELLLLGSRAPVVSAPDTEGMTMLGALIGLHVILSGSGSSKLRISPEQFNLP